ncbi:MAG: AmmeMemoRadiSam system protein B [Defluviitaleaceae bacterium]|nr:AmmeMemoRadiSam system protein B [Defluviitaleaceae bacterium]
MKKIYATLIMLLLVAGTIYLAYPQEYNNGIGYDYSRYPSSQPPIQTHEPNNERRNSLLHLTHSEFIRSIENPRVFFEQPTGKIRAGVVPHHNIAATLISGFFSATSYFAEYYDLVIVIGPNHETLVSSVVSSYRHWDIGDGVFTHQGFVQDLMDSNEHVAIDHGVMVYDHSVSILIPYIYHYLPGVPVAPLLVSRRLSFEQTLELFWWIQNWIEKSQKNVLLVASIDFSHFLTVPQSRVADQTTKEAIRNHDLQTIHRMNYHHVDSAASLIIFLLHLQELGLTPQIVAHTDASEFLGPGVDETTSYMIIMGIEQTKQTQQVQLSFVGDIMLHERQMQNLGSEGVASSFFYSFYHVSHLLQEADLAIGNLETVLGGFFMDSSHYSFFPRFSAPDPFAYALFYAGFDILTTANNHSLDQGVGGLTRTIDTLESIGIANVGTYRTREERDSILVKEVSGIRFSFLAYTFGTNMQYLPNDQDYLLNILNRTVIKNDIQKAREVSDFVVVLPHMGYEYELAVRDSIKDWAMFFVEAGADIVIKNHPHVVQPMGFVTVLDYANGETKERTAFVAYSLGNFISSQTKPHTNEGVILNLHFAKRHGEVPVLEYATVVPTWVGVTTFFGRPIISVLPICYTLHSIDNFGNIFGNINTAQLRMAREHVLGQIFNDMPFSIEDRFFFKIH